MDKFTYKGSNFPARSIVIFPGTEDEMCAMVSIDALQQRLLTKDGNYVDEEARFIDEQICYYLTSEEFMLSEEEIRKIVENAY